MSADVCCVFEILCPFAMENKGFISCLSLLPHCNRLPLSCVAHWLIAWSVDYLVDRVKMYFTKEEKLRRRNRQMRSQKSLRWNQLRRNKQIELQYPKVFYHHVSIGKGIGFDHQPSNRTPIVWKYTNLFRNLLRYFEILLHIFLQECVVVSGRSPCVSLIG